MSLYSGSSLFVLPTRRGTRKEFSDLQVTSWRAHIGITYLYNSGADLEESTVSSPLPRSTTTTRRGTQSVLGLFWKLMTTDYYCYPQNKPVILS